MLHGDERSEPTTSAQADSPQGATRRGEGVVGVRFDAHIQRGVLKSNAGCRGRGAFSPKCSGRTHAGLRSSEALSLLIYVECMRLLSRLVTVNQIDGGREAGGAGVILAYLTRRAQFLIFRSAVVEVCLNAGQKLVEIGIRQSRASLAQIIGDRRTGHFCSPAS